MEKMTRYQYIDGLRGLAIAIIVLFHAFPEKFGAGYLGVDIFLVISGYFMFRKPIDFANGLLASCKTYLIKKANRLLPSLVSVVFICLLLSPYFLVPNDEWQANLTGLSSLFGASNMFLHYISNDYFAEDTSYNPLVHTWYLSTIWQVYLLFLLGSLLLWGRSKCVIYCVAAIIGLLSFFCFEYNTAEVFAERVGIILPSAIPHGYYETIPRLWEIIVGGAFSNWQTYSKNTKKSHAVLALSCLSILILACLCPHGENCWKTPVVVMCTGACLVYGESRYTNTILACPAISKLGSVSFSLYLLHVPIFTFTRCITNSIFSMPVAIALALLLSVAKHRYIETQRFNASKWCVWGASVCVGMLLYIYPQSSLFWEHDVIKRPKYTKWAIADEALYAEGYDWDKLIVWSRGLEKPENDAQMLLLGTEQASPSVKPSFVVIGDSHATTMSQGIDTLCRNTGGNICGLLATTFITPFYGWSYHQNKSWHCDSNKLDALCNWLEKHPEIRTIVIVQRWYSRLSDTYLSNSEFHSTPPLYLTKEAGLRAFLKKLQGIGKQIVIFTPAPEMAKFTLRSIMYNRQRGQTWRDEITCKREKYDADSRSSFDLLEKMEAEGLCRLLHIENALFKDGDWRAVKNDVYMMQDTNHLTPAASDEVLMICEKEFCSLIYGGF